jgi:CheY-like chemotaxis protein
MSIALRIISNHEGLIWAESRLGHGARFVVELPAGGTMESLPDGGRLTSGSESREAEDFPEYGKRILVIDDEEPVVTLITEILMLDNHEVTPAYNGAEALALLRANDYDLILSDVRMPAVGGPTFFEILQTTRPDLLPRVIFVTGDTMSNNTREFLQRAARPVLVKPFDPEKLRRMVNENLGLNS